MVQFSHENADGDEIGAESQYQDLQNSILELEKSKRVIPATRHEVESQISEYHLKSRIKRAEIDAGDLAKVLSAKGKHSKLDKVLKKANKKEKILKKPLEKPIAERIKRRSGYEKAKVQLGRWEPVVQSNRIADHLIFPLNDPKFTLQGSKEFLNRYPSAFDKALTCDGTQEKDEEVADDYPLTLEEMLEKRKEMAQLRARQSYLDAKAHRQKKIKSKKYHRIQKREKVRQQLKEFELLQKTDPDAALKKLEELERSRAEERATLKHRSTGKWAKNLSVRAKYDKESRKALAEQLSISKDLAMKATLNESSDDEEEHITPAILKTAMDVAESNPWSLEVTDEVNSFISGFKKFCNDTKSAKPSDATLPEKNDTSLAMHKEDAQVPADQVVNIKKKKNSAPVEKLRIGRTGNWTVTKCLKDKTSIRTKATDFDIEEEFDLAEEKIAARKINKLEKVKPNEQKRLRPKLIKSQRETELKKSRWQIERVQVDEELGNTNEESDSVNRVPPPSSVSQEKSSMDATEVNIDPDNFLKVKPTVMKTAVPDNITVGDDGLDDDDQEQVIMEAFADDNVAAEFKERKSIEAKTTELEVVTELPGWGSWGGAGVKPDTRRKKRRFLPNLPKRKDTNMPDVIINEESNPHIKNHMVKEVPFPFMSVEAFEANIRAPISREWVPELSHADLIRPAVITRQGKIIEPMSEDVLLRNQPVISKNMFVGKRNKKSKKSNIKVTS